MTLKKRFSCAAVAALMFATAAMAQEKLGNVTFPTSCDAKVQARFNRAVAMLRAAAEMEDKSEKAAVTPGRLVPARELLGEMLLEMNRPTEALLEFEASEKHDPNRFRGLYGAGKAATLAGDQAKAKSYFEKLVTLAKSADTERPEIKEARELLAKK